MNFSYCLPVLCALLLFWEDVNLSSSSSGESPSLVLPSNLASSFEVPVGQAAPSCEGAASVAAMLSFLVYKKMKKQMRKAPWASKHLRLYLE